MQEKAKQKQELQNKLLEDLSSVRMEKEKEAEKTKLYKEKISASKKESESLTQQLQDAVDSFKRSRASFVHKAEAINASIRAVIQMQRAKEAETDRLENSSLETEISKRRQVK